MASRPESRGLDAMTQEKIQEIEKRLAFISGQVYVILGLNIFSLVIALRGGR